MTNQEIIKKRANDNPLEAYFLGGFHLLSKEKQEKTIKKVKIILAEGINLDLLD